jgi:hypothetical protein
VKPLVRLLGFRCDNLLVPLCKVERLRVQVGGELEKFAFEVVDNFLVPRK